MSFGMIIAAIVTATFYLLRNTVLVAPSTLQVKTAKSEWKALPQTESNSTVVTLHAHTSDNTRSNSLLVQPEDSIYRLTNVEWDNAPIVIKEYKLVFFAVPKVGCTTFKQLFRRMMGFKDFMRQSAQLGLPHNPAKNGLMYLWNYSLAEANEMMTSPEYTKAIFVRDPITRFVSAYLDKGVRNFRKFLEPACCKVTRDCVNDHVRTVPGFLDLIRNCSNNHWNPQNRRMESKYWEYIDFVGHIENLQDDGSTLLNRIGAGKYLRMGGWGKHGKDSRLFRGENGQKHLTNATSRRDSLLTTEMYRQIEEFYAEDYENPLLGFHRQYQN